jgi:hypothetical protein
MKNESKRAERMGEVFTNNYGNTFKIVEYKNARKVTVEFECGYTTTAAYSSCKKGGVSCPYDKRYNAVACIGLKKDGTEPICYINGKPTKAYALWCAMINRVYNKKQLKYHPGYKKSKVCERWLVFANFLEDLPNIPNYELWLHSDQYELDKDLLQHGQEFKIYSPTTCMFVPKNVNIRLPKPKKEKAPKPKKVIRLTHIESGMYMHFDKQQQVADKLGVTQSYISRLVKKGDEYNGYKIEVLEVE